jgi:UDP-hydrolysing UDP-N-acetyl-D-glucosamine 2-epimerase
MQRRKVCVVTGSRADYGLLFWVMKCIQDDPDMTLQVAVTGMHLSPEFGQTVRFVEADGFPIAARVDSLLPGDSVTAVTKSIGRGVIGFADALEQLQPDLLVLLGDRFEIFAAAQAALVARIPVAHIAGGDVTEGAFDDAIRHSITKMSHLHFVTNAAAESRVRQLGEDPRFIFNFGSPGLDALARTHLLTRPEVEAAIGFQFKTHNLLVTFHPATLDAVSSFTQLSELLRALDTLGPGFGVIFTKSNADTEGLTLNRMIGGYVESRPNCRLFDSLGQQKYLSVMNQVDVLVGNSSSGLYEAPSLHKPTVNIGDRQKGRLRAASVLDCEPRADAIERGIRAALRLDCSAVKNPYGDGDSAPRIVAALKAVADPRALVRKEFVDA